MPWEDSGYGLRLLPEPHFDCNHVHGHIDGLQVTGSSHRPGAICRLLREIVDSEEAQVSRRTIERFSKWCHWNGTGAALHHAHAIALALFGNIPMRFLNERDGPIPDRDEENTRYREWIDQVVCNVPQYRVLLLPHRQELREAFASGNIVYWICQCSTGMPHQRASLVGRLDEHWDLISDSEVHVGCPHCSRVYIIRPGDTLGAVGQIECQ